MEDISRGVIYMRTRDLDYGENWLMVFYPEEKKIIDAYGKVAGIGCWMINEIVSRGELVEICEL